MTNTNTPHPAAPDPTPSPATHTAFAGARCVAHGPLAEVLTALKARHDRQADDLVLVFELASGRQVDFDLSGPLDAVLARALPEPAAARGAGRPKLGVTAREVTLLPRHWQWLEQQQAGVSGALRRLVEDAIRQEPPAAKAAAHRAALGRLLTALAGDRPRYEDATRALYAGDTAAFIEAVQKWPKDVRALAVAQAEAAQRIADGGGA